MRRFYAYYYRYEMIGENPTLKVDMPKIHEKAITRLDVNEVAEFLDYVESVCNEFREFFENAKGTTPYCVKKVAVLNSWCKIRSWGCHMVHHAL